MEIQGSIEDWRSPERQYREIRRERRENGREIAAGSDARIVDRAQALGWLSIGLGVAQIAAPGAFARVVGLPDNRLCRTALFCVGVREIASGLGMLGQVRPRRWAWSRAAGDAMDIALLGSALASPQSRRGRLAAVAAAVAAIGAIDVLTARQLERSSPEGGANDADYRWVHFTRSVTINRPLEEVQRRWREFESADGEVHGRVHFTAAPGNRGTELHMEHDRFLGPGATAALRRFKQLVETGEVVRSDASIHRRPHPARPSLRQEREATR